MISRSEPSGPRAGVTLLETMVSLAILSLVLAVAATAVRPPSPWLQEQAAIAELTRRAQETRLRAITETLALVMVTDALCPDAPPPTFFADGSATGGPVCVGSQELAIRPFTGAIGVAP